MHGKALEEGLAHTKKHSLRSFSSHHLYPGFLKWLNPSHYHLKEQQQKNLEKIKLALTACLCFSFQEVTLFYTHTQAHIHNLLGNKQGQVNTQDIKPT